MGLSSDRYNEVTRVADDGVSESVTLRRRILPKNRERRARKN